MSKFVVLSEKMLSVTGTSVLAVLFVNVLSVLYAIHVFVQFSPFQVLGVLVVFLALLLAMSSVFLKRIDIFPVEINLRNICAALAVTLFLVMLYSAQGDTPSMSWYVKTFPVLEAQLGLGWHQDTAFHVSLIQSILNFGYPSIGQHGHPLAAYHVLSHYVDALILMAVGVDPFDSYGLMVHFKVVLFFSLTLLSLAHLCRHHGPMTYLLSIGLLLPVLVGDWHIVRSHGLWVPSLLLVACIPFVVSLLYREDRPRAGELAALFFLIVLLSLGKVSTGFMFACFIGLWIFLKNPFSLRTITFGVAVLGFFYVYGALFIAGINDVAMPMDLSGLELHRFYSYMMASDIVRAGRSKEALTGQLLLIITLFIVLMAMRPSWRNGYVLAAASLSLLGLWIITEANSGLGINDVWYFQYGLSSVLVLMGYALVLQNKAALANTFSSYPEPMVRRVTAVLAVSALVLFASKLNMAGYNLFSFSWESAQARYTYIRMQAFSKINSRVASGERYRLFEPYERKSESIYELYKNQALTSLKDHVGQQLAKQGLRPSQVALFIPLSIYNTDVAGLKGVPWANGMLMYAILGVPMVNAVADIPSGYGFSRYSAAAMRKDAAAFSPQQGCVQAGAEAILIMTRFSPPITEVYTCTDVAQGEAESGK
ncbi:hypothetical protein [uncultured Porticoccus sp.]|uniref:hypothetical protein n=1 Tax=uncultured Porticoccus sp. TaxID=1256050 RepID=UPI00262518D6|nr:hypothetical protein [uncultured Porticoccus sp.]